MHPRLTVVIPVHNEETFLPVALPALVGDMDALGEDWNLLLVENGSSDATARAAEEFLGEWRGNGRVIRLPDPDYGAALRAGMLEATGEWIVMFDIDYFSADFVAKAMTAGADIVIASKRAPGSHDRRTWTRRTGTWGFNLLLRALFGSRVGDTHGMKVFRRSTILPLLTLVVSTKDLFDTELVLRAERAGVSIVELPVVVEEKRSARSSFVKRIPRTLRGLLRLRRIL